MRTPGVEDSASFAMLRDPIRGPKPRIMAATVPTADALTSPTETISISASRRRPTASSCAPSASQPRSGASSRGPDTTKPSRFNRSTTKQTSAAETSLRRRSTIPSSVKEPSRQCATKRSARPVNSRDPVSETKTTPSQRNSHAKFSRNRIRSIMIFGAAHKPYSSYSASSSNRRG